MALQQFLRLLVLTSALMLFSACSSTNPDEPKEVKPKEEELLTSDAPESVLLDTAQTLYMNGLYSVARDSFQSLYTTYPMGAYVEFAKIKAADAAFLMSEYEMAAADYENFLKDHPGHSSRDYVSFRAGLSHYMNNKGVGRDIAPLEQALTLFQKTQENYPNSVFAKSAKYYQVEAEKKLAEHNRTVLDFYAKRGNEKAYANRESEFSNKWAGVLKTQNTWPKQQQASLKLGAPDQNWEKEQSDYSLSNPNSLFAKAALKSVPEKISGRIILQAVKCRTSSKPTITFVFDNSPESLGIVENFARTNSQLEPVAGVVKLDIGQIGGEIKKHSCMSSEDIALNENGVITIASSSSFYPMQISNPNRLILLPIRQ